MSTNQLLSIFLLLGIVCNLVYAVLLALISPDPSLAGLTHIEISQHARVRVSLDPRDRNRNPPAPIPLKDVWLAGIVLDATKIQDRVWEALLQLNCEYNIGIYIISKDNAEVASKNFMDMASKKRYGHDGHSGNHAGHLYAPVDIISQDEAFRNLANRENVVSTRNFDHNPVHPNDLAFANNRIDRLSALRDVQRMLLLEKYLHSHSSHDFDDNNITNSSVGGADEMKDGIVIIADLDLSKLPKLEVLVEQMIKLQNSSGKHTESTTEHMNIERQQERYPHDAICAAGVTEKLSHNKHGRGDSETERWYYDTFATVFYPDTFSHPLKRRLISKFYTGEDPKLVRSDDQHGKFTQRDIYQYMKREGGKSSTGNLRVTSCFGGMAIYRASVYFESKCRYRLTDTKNDVDTMLEEAKGGVQSMTIMRYASAQEERPCEHVVFHDCLKKHSDGFDIAVNPNLVSFWKRD